MYSGGRGGGGGASFAGGGGGPGRGAPWGAFAAAGGGGGRWGYGTPPPGRGYYGGGADGGGYQQGPPNRNVTCYACGNAGHLSRDCPDASAGGPRGYNGSSGRNGSGLNGGGNFNGGGFNGGGHGAAGSGGGRFARGGSPQRNGRGGGNGGPPQWQREGGGWLVPLPDSTEHAVLAAAKARQSGPRTVWVMRGLPGSGKSTRAAEIAAAAAAEAAAGPTGDAHQGDKGGRGAGAAGKVWAIHSTDSYFVEEGSGQYVFDPSRLSEHHEANYSAFEGSLAAGVACVIVDNTNLQTWQFGRYVTAAWRAGYAVREEVVGAFDSESAATYAARCTHAVPLEKILLMAQQWQRG